MHENLVGRFPLFTLGYILLSENTLANVEEFVAALYKTNDNVFFFWFSAFLGRFVRPVSPFFTLSGYLLQLAVILLHHPVQQHHSRSSSCLLSLPSSLNC